MSCTWDLKIVRYYSVIDYELVLPYTDIQTCIMAMSGIAEFSSPRQDSRCGCNPIATGPRQRSGQPGLRPDARDLSGRPAQSDDDEHQNHGEAGNYDAQGWFACEGFIGGIHVFPDLISASSLECIRSCILSIIGNRCQPFEEEKL